MYLQRKSLIIQLHWYAFEVLYRVIQPQERKFHQSPGLDPHVLLSIEIWVKETLDGIKNIVGDFFKIYELNKMGISTSYAKICVYMNVEGVLL
jgi:hypothetical protein